MSEAGLNHPACKNRVLVASVFSPPSFFFRKKNIIIISLLPARTYIQEQRNRRHHQTLHLAGARDAGNAKWNFGMTPFLTSLAGGVLEDQHPGSFPPSILLAPARINDVQTRRSIARGRGGRVWAAGEATR